MQLRPVSDAVSGKKETYRKTWIRSHIPTFPKSTVCMHNSLHYVSISEFHDRFVLITGVGAWTNPCTVVQ